MKFGLNFGFAVKSFTAPLLQGEYIWYNLNPQTGFLTDPETKIRKVNDLGNTSIFSIGTGTYDGIMQAGRNVALSSDGYVDVPINAILGDDNALVTRWLYSISGEGNTTISNGDGTFDIPLETPTDNDWQPLIYFAVDEADSHKPLNITLEVEVTAGEIYLYKIVGGNPDGSIHITQYDMVLGVGTHLIEYNGYVRTDTGTNELHIQFNGADGYNTCDAIATIIAREIQDVQGQITYFDFSQNKHISIGENGTELVENGDFSDGLNGWTLTNTTPESVSLDVVNGQLKVDVIGENSSEPYIEQNTSFKANHRYYFSGNYIDKNNLEFYWSINKNLDFEPPIRFDTVGSSYGYSMCLNNISSFSFLCRGSRNIGNYSIFDDLSIIEALPLSTHYRLENVTFNSLVVLWDRSMTQDDRDMMDNDPELLVRWGLGEDVGFSIGTKGANDKYYACTEDGDYLLEIDKDPNDALPINGTYSRIKNSSYGIQTLRLELDTDGVPTRFLNTHQMKFHAKGEQVDSGIIVDGSQTDFTMMVAISSDMGTDAGNLAKLVGGGGYFDTNNIMLLEYDKGAHQLNIGIGDTVWYMPIDDTKPINALCAIYNHTTGEVTGAMNGDPLQSFGTIVFDKPHTATIRFGGADNDNDRTNHYMGEGIASTTIETEEAWFAYWDRVKDSYCFKEVGEQFSNPYFDCGLDFWSDNSSGGSYSGTLVDNSDGTVTLTANDDVSPAYYSIEPENKVLEAGDYLATAEVTALAAVNGWKMSYHLTSGTWGDAIVSTTAERARAVITIGDTDNWNIGHSNATTGESITFGEISLIKINATESPCMNSADTPYGHVEASHTLSSYVAWKGFNCTRVNGSDSWLTPSIANDAISPENEEVWFEWYLTDEDIDAGMSLMIPTEVVVYPRSGMTEGWYTDNNPFRMRVKGIADDMSEFTILDEYYTDDWVGSGTRTLDLRNLTTTLCRGLKVYILGTRQYEGGGIFHSGWGYAKFYGVYSGRSPR